MITQIIGSLPGSVCRTVDRCTHDIVALVCTGCVKSFEQRTNAGGPWSRRIERTLSPLSLERCDSFCTSRDQALGEMIPAELLVIKWATMGFCMPATPCVIREIFGSHVPMLRAEHMSATTLNSCESKLLSTSFFMALELLLPRLATVPLNKPQLCKPQ